MSDYGEPWRCRPGTTEFISCLSEPSNQQSIGMIFLRDPKWRPSETELTERIVACVNACERWSTEELESGCIDLLVSAASGL